MLVSHKPGALDPGASRPNTVPTVDTQREKGIELDSALKRRLYHPLFLLTALNKCRGMERRSGSRTLGRLTGDQVHTFQDFVNRVALLCQTKAGGDAVSACVVLQTFSGVMYLFTSNSRQDSELEEVAREVESILRMVSSRQKADVETLMSHKEILRKILLLVRPRVQLYLKRLVGLLEKCIETCKRETDEQGIATTTSGNVSGH